MRKRHLVVIFIALLLSWPLLASELKLEVIEHQLANGLKLLMVPRSGVPRVVCHIYYKVGSVNEHPGITGIAHVLEHMMFKGTKIMGVTDFEANHILNQKIDELMEKIYREKYWKKNGDMTKVAEWEKEVENLLREEKKYIIKDHLWETYMKHGGTGLNASTSDEVTGYYVTLPSNKIELQMLLEADRMINAYFREFYSEKDVVMEERRLSENSPGFLFSEQVRATFFVGSPYQWNVIGWMDDLKKMTKEDLIDFHKKYYVPNNAVAVYVGDFDPKMVIQLAEKYFGPIPRGKDIEPVRTPVQVQNCEKRVIGEGPAPSSIALWFHIPPDGKPDAYPLFVLASILTGDTGRLYKSLILEKDVATMVSAFCRPQWYAGSFVINARPKTEKGIRPDDLESHLWAELEKVKKEGVTPEELQKAKNRYEASFIMSLQSPTALASRLGRAELNRGWRSLITDLEAIKKVTNEDIKAVASKYIVRSNSLTAINRRSFGR